jgi:serine/threonine protein kinase/WD40 repeat protein
MSESLKKRLRLKCRYDGEIRTVTVGTDFDYSRLKKRLTSDYGFEVSLKYEDKEGDLIILASQNDFDDLILSGSETVNVIVSEQSILPNLSRLSTSNRGSIGTPLQRTSSLFNNSSLAAPTPSSSFSPNPFNNKDWAKPGIGTTGGGNSLLRIATANSKDLGFNKFPSIDVQEIPDKAIRWKKGEMLGQGAFGVVYLGLNVESGELMAVKQMAIDEVSSKELSSLENEINLLRNLRHPNIVRYIGTEVNPTALSIFLEYVPGGSLKALIDKFGMLEESVAKSYTRQLLLGLEYLHRNGIAHRDIKGANCLVGNDGVVKLADFGNSKHWRTKESFGTGEGSVQQQSGDIKGTPSWMAPEVIREQGGNISWRKADVWSLACTSVEMTTGKPPWSQFSNSVTILYHIACQDTLPEYPTNATIELITFLNVCLQRDPSLRPDITSLLLHPFVANVGASGWNTAAGMGFSNRPTTVSTTPAEWDSGGSWRVEQVGRNPPSIRTRASSVAIIESENSLAPEFTSTNDEIDDNSSLQDLQFAGNGPLPERRLNSREVKKSSNTSSQNIIDNLEDSCKSLDSLDESKNIQFNTIKTPRELAREAVIKNNVSLSASTTPRAQHHQLNLLNGDKKIKNVLDLPLKNIKNSPIDPSLFYENNVTNQLNPENTHENDLQLSRARHNCDLNDNDLEDSSSITTEIIGILQSKNDKNATSIASSPRLGEMPPINQTTNNKSNFNKIKSKNNQIESNIKAKSSVSNLKIPKKKSKKLITDLSDSENPNKTSSPKINNRRKNVHSAKIPSTHHQSKDNIARMRAGSLDGINSSNINQLPIKEVEKSLIIEKSSQEQSSTENIYPKLDDKDLNNLSMSDEDGSSVVTLCNGGATSDVEKVIDVNIKCDGSVGSIDRDSIGSNSKKDLSFPFKFSSPPGLNMVVNDGDSVGDFVEIDGVLDGGDSDFSIRQGESAEGGDIGNDSYEDLDMESSVEGDLNISMAPLVDVEHNNNATNNLFNNLSTSPVEFMQKVNLRLELSGLEGEVTPIISHRKTITNSSNSSKNNDNSNNMNELWANDLVIPLIDKMTKRDGSRTAKSNSKPNIGQLPHTASTSSLEGLSNFNLPLEMQSLSIENSSNLGQAINNSGMRLKTISTAPSHSIPGGNNTPTSRAKQRLQKEKELKEQQELDLGGLVGEALIRGGLNNIAVKVPELNSSLTKQRNSVVNNNMISRDKDPCAWNDVCEATIVSSEERSGVTDRDKGKSISTYNPIILDEHSGIVTKLHTCHKDKLLISSSSDGTVRLWGIDDSNPSESRLVLDANNFIAPSSRSDSHPNNRRLSSGKRNSESIDQSSETIGKIVEERKRRIKVLNTWTDDNCDSIWGACSDGALRVWDGEEGKPLRLLKGHDDAVTAMEGVCGVGGVSSSSLVGTGSVDKTVRIWDVRAKRSQVFLFRGHSDTILELRWGEGGRTVLSTGKDKSVRIWDTRAGR